MVETPTFETPRLLAKEWHSLGPDDWDPRDLRGVVSTMLTEKVTAPLLPAWQGLYTHERAAGWIEARDREGTTLLVVNRSEREPVGLLLFFESDEDPSRVDVRLGYLISESAWGHGFATELVRGFVGWCRSQDVSSITGGVERGNAASIRVLEKNGFVRTPNDGPVADEEFFVLHL